MLMAMEQQTAPTLFDLPVELLLKITSLIPDKDELSLTCKKFYNLVFLCDTSRKYKINIKHEDLLLDFPTFCHILTTTRVLDTIDFTVYSTASKLFWERLARIISTRSFSSLIVNNSESKGNDHQLSEIFNKTLRENSLMELQLIGVSPDISKNFLSRQKFIGSISLTGCIDADSAESINELGLNSLVLSLTDGSNEARIIINSQPTLRKLVFECSDDLFNIDLVSKNALLNLEELQLPKSCKDFAPIAELKKLKKWTVDFNSSIPMLPSLEELHLTVDEHTTKQDCVQLSEKLKNLKILSVTGTLAINCLVECTSNFHKLESFSLLNHKSIYCKIADFPSVKLNKNLKHLKIVNQDPKVVIYSADLTRYLKTFETLQTVSLETLSELSCENLRQLLRSLTSIRELAIDLLQRCFSHEAMQQLASDLKSQKLEFVRLINFRSDCDENCLRSVFTEIPIVEKRQNNLILRKHGHYRLLKSAISDLK